MAPPLSIPHLDVRHMSIRRPKDVEKSRPLIRLGYKIPAAVCSLVSLILLSYMIFLRLKWGEWVNPGSFGLVIVGFVVSYLVYVGGKNDSPE